MKNLQRRIYDQAAEEFSRQMDPSDKTRSFYIDKCGNTLGFQIVRADGGILEYDAAARQYHALPADAATTFDLHPEDGIMDLPPMEYTWQQGKDKMYKTNHFPSEDTAATYQSLRDLQKKTTGFQFQIALAMTQLPEDILDPTELYVLANKAVLMYCSSNHHFALEEITSSINDVIQEGASFTIGTDYREFPGAAVKQALLTADQEGFQNLIAAAGERSRSDGYEYSGSGLSYDSMQVLTEEMNLILPHLEAAENNSKIKLDRLIHFAKSKTSSPTARDEKHTKAPDYKI